MVALAERIADFFAQPVWAVVGASRDPEKESHQLVLTLRALGHRVYPVNPQAPEVAGLPAYPNLSALPERPDVVVIAVRPESARAPLAEAARLGVRRVWFQPGADDPDVVALAERLGLTVVHQACALLTSRLRLKERSGG